MRRTGITAAVVHGVAGGAAGTLAMDLLWYRRLRRGGGEEAFLDWELSRSTTGFDGAPAPARIGEALWRTITGGRLPDERAALTNNVVHWATGLQWAVLYALVARSLGGARVAHGPLLGSVAWGSAYAILPAMGVYRPVWEYEREVLAEDLTAHLLFGVVAAATVRALAGPRRPARPVC